MSVLVNLVVKCETAFGTQLYVTGGDYVLYNWAPVLSLYCHNFPIWSRSIYLKEGSTVEFKFVKITEENQNRVQEWETIKNRKIKIGNHGIYTITTSFNNAQYTIEYDQNLKFIEKINSMDLKENDLLSQLLQPARLSNQILAICPLQSYKSVRS